jgi:hypothetical protein
MITMESLFSPCARFYTLLEERQGRLEEFRRRNPEPLPELNLDVSTEAILSADKALHSRICTPRWETKIRWRG